MSIEERKIAHVTISNVVEVSKRSNDEYEIGFYDHNKKSEGVLSIRRELLMKEFHLRGMARGVISYYYGDDEIEHELTFEELEENNDYRDEFDKLVQDIVIEMLNLDTVRELEKYKALAVTENKMVVLFEQKDSIGKIGKTYKKQA